MVKYILSYFENRLIFVATLSLVVVTVMSCNRNDFAETSTDDTIAVNIMLNMKSTKSFSNDGLHNVNRVLIIPFQKTAENLANTDGNFVPVYNYAKQIDINTFPINSAVINLPTQTTYKVLIIGYNQSDYNFNDRNNPANRFDLGSTTLPTTLDNFHVYPKAAIIVPEIYTCIGTAYNGAVSQGPTFKPEQGFSLSGTLGRMTSGFSVTLNNIPAYVKSVTLVAENLVKASKAKDATVTVWQTAGDNGNRIIDKKTPVSGSVSFSKYLLPTFDTYKTAMYLDIEFGSSTQKYPITVADGAATSGNKFIFRPNEAINLLGSYNSINFGFIINLGINLDDDNWDGYNNNDDD